MSYAGVNLKQQAYERIRELIRTGGLPVGTRVSTLSMSRRLGISRTPIREALSRLASDGVVREVPGFGVYVYQANEEELVELYGMREVLESYATRLATEHIDQQELSRLNELCQEWRAIAHHMRDNHLSQLDPKLQNRWIRIDEQFHQILLKAARNKLLIKTIDDMRLMSRTLQLRRLDPDYVITLSGAVKTYRDHVRLVRALERRDAAGAEMWMHRQIVMGRERHLAFVRARQAQQETREA